MVRRIEEQGLTAADAAAAAGLSARRTYHWLGRYRAGGERMLCDRSSAPARYCYPVPAAHVPEIERLRRQHMAGPWIARRLGMGRRSELVPKPSVIRHRRQRPGDIIHIDTKKLGRIEGIGHRIPATIPGSTAIAALAGT